MRAVTRLHSNVDGSIVENVSRLDFGAIKTGMSSEIRVISLDVTGVQQISNVNLEIIGSDAIDVSEGGFRYFTTKTFVRKEILPLSFDYAGCRIFVRNLTNRSTEYVYLNIDTQKTNFTGVGNVHFRWKFDIVEGSSSSSSGVVVRSGCQKVYAGGVFNLDMAIGTSRCFEIFLESTEYATLLLNGNELVVENNGGVYSVMGVDLTPTSGSYYVFMTGQAFEITFLGYGSLVFSAKRTIAPGSASLNSTYRITGYTDGDFSVDATFQPHPNPYQEPWDGSFSRSNLDYYWEKTDQRMNTKKMEKARLFRHGDDWIIEVTGPDLSNFESYFWFGIKTGGDTPDGIYMRTGGVDTTSAILLGT